MNQTKLTLKKITITRLDTESQSAVNGGGMATTGGQICGITLNTQP
ncbi:MAG: hypothetical protein GY765_39145 [bacterium]|nr:hypothetical protein [bacterium]